MDLIQALILSSVEGVSEFLPISSTGHQVLVANLLQINQTEFVKSFEIIIQLGAILAVVVVYWRKFLEMKELWKLLLVALLPTLAVGLIFYQIIKTVLIGNPTITVMALGLGGVAMIVIEKYYMQRKEMDKTVENLSMKKAFLIGVGQSVSIIPGVSRAAATIFSGMLVGLNRQTAVEFSFLLAVPTMIAATSLDLMKSGFNFRSSEIGLLVVGCIGSFVTGLLVIRWLVRYVSHHNFVGFGVYRIVFSLAYWYLILR